MQSFRRLKKLWSRRNMFPDIILILIYTCVDYLHNHNKTTCTHAYGYIKFAKIDKGNGACLTETAIYKVQRGVTKKIHMQELWFLRSVRRLLSLIFVGSFMKIYRKVFFQVREWTRFCDGKTGGLP